MAAAVRAAGPTLERRAAPASSPVLSEHRHGPCSVPPPQGPQELGGRGPRLRAPRAWRGMFRAVVPRCLTDGEIAP